jgi:hypothetical protein
MPSSVAGGVEKVEAAVSIEIHRSVLTQSETISVETYFAELTPFPSFLVQLAVLLCGPSGNACSFKPRANDQASGRWEC